MSNMCRCYDAELTEANRCNNKMENETLDSNGHIGCCNFCMDKQKEKYRVQDAPSPVAASIIRSGVSLSDRESFDSSCSDSGDYSVDMYSYFRNDQEESAMHDNKVETNFSLNGHFPNSALTTGKGNDISGTMKENEEKVDHVGRDVESSIINNGQEQRVGALESFDGSYTVKSQGSDASYSSGSELDDQIWDPPEPEDSDDDVEGSVANFDDDDDFGDGTKWGKPMSLSRIGEDGRGNSVKAEKQRAMEEVMNGRFKALVGQLLKSVGVSLTGGDNESWIDVVPLLTWEAASFVKADPAESKGMDPDGYVKVKCIASGSRVQSQLIKGLVFKKHAAHKHMPTRYKNPKLLLIRGMLGQSSGGLSSLNFLDKERSNVNSIIEMFEICHPNVVLVEKSVSRDVQEYILKKGMTLVFDMKLHRLERVARCTGSPILSPETFMAQKLKQCDDFHFEKFIEEHAASVEGGKRPSKTLMFIEGCPTRFGCTILLKGSHSDELKKVKCVVKCAFVMAYILILETSFLFDQRAMFCTVPCVGMQGILPNGHQSSFSDTTTSTVSCLGAFTGEHQSSSKSDLPITGSENVTLGPETDSVFCEPFNPDVFDGLSPVQVSLKKVICDSFPQSSTTYQSLSSYLGLNGRKPGGETKFNFDEEKSIDGEHISCEFFQDTGKFCSCNEDLSQGKDEIGTVLDSQSILVLLSSRNASKGTTCEQIHFSHIKFYKNFDVPLGKFLRDNLLNQKHQCTVCGQPPDAHFYYYAHHKKQLTVQARQLLPEKRLPGLEEGKIWMWSRCGKCKPWNGSKKSTWNGSTKSTKRVLISAATRRLSFGKFLEMRFSPVRTPFKESSCGHSLDEDFLYFFGLGLMVAMFRSSPVVTFTVSMPPQKLELCSHIRCEWLDKEIENVHKKGISLFTDVESSLKKMRLQFQGSTPNCVHPKSFARIEEMLRQERSEFEESIQTVMSGSSNRAVYKLLSLNRLLWELLLESCVWDQRLHSLSSNSEIAETATSNRGRQGQCKAGDDAACKTTGIVTDESEIIDDSLVVKVKLGGKIPEKDSPVAGSLEGRPGDLLSMSTEVQGTLSDYSESDRIIPVIADLRESSSSSSLNSSQRGCFLCTLLSDIENSKENVWSPFPEIRHDCTEEIRKGLVPKLEPLSIQSTEFLPSARQLINEVGPRLPIYLSRNDFVLLDLEAELSSIIACALALLRNSPEARKGVVESSHGNPESASLASSHSSVSNDSWDADGSHVSLEESRFSSFDGFNLLNSLVSFGDLHPEVSLGQGKPPGKGKYSVVCFYYNQFCNLRNRCCSSELDYIASLSRCRNWDAKGGKSKCFFAKTLDERFIIKEIKKTEFVSFMKFGLDYFKYMNFSFDTGTQTCLAKILGIYQVRVMKSGKEAKHDVMVMENLTFGRNVSRQYDLKGALHARFSSATDDVQLDQNFVNDMNASPLYLSNKAKRMLQRAVWNDTTFLHSVNVMDYSLLVGVDRERRELVCGIIDYLRQYTWDKQLETWVKSSLVVPKNQMPTVISPGEYKKRFRKFMSTHFLSLPDHWCSEACSDPCRLCAAGL